MFLLMYMKLNYFLISTFYIEVKATEILKYILIFSREKNVLGQGKNYPAFENC